MPPPSSTTAIILIDPYNDFLHPSGKITPALLPSLTASSTVAHLQTVVRTARAHGIPIFYCLHQPTRPGFLVGWRHSTALQQSQRDGNAFEEGSWGAECLEGLGSDIAAGDVVVSKHWSSSSFQNTDLDYQLRQRGIEKVVLAGLVANTCLESTARYAYEHAYHVTMLKDATAGWTTEQKDAATDLIWPLFAQEVTTVGEWVANVEKKA